VSYVLKETRFNICGSVGRTHSGGATQDRGEMGSQFWLKMLIASAKWRYSKAYKLAFNEEAKKQILEINSVRKELSCCDSTLSSQQQHKYDFFLSFQPSGNKDFTAVLGPRCQRDGWVRRIQRLV
jgi:hypothetical protein